MDVVQLRLGRWGARELEDDVARALPQVRKSKGRVPALHLPRTCIDARGFAMYGALPLGKVTCV